MLIPPTVVAYEKNQPLYLQAEIVQLEHYQQTYTSSHPLALTS